MATIKRSAPRMFPPDVPTPLEQQQLQVTACVVLGEPGATGETLLNRADEGVTATALTMTRAAAGADDVQFVVFEAFVGDTAVGAAFALAETTVLAECGDGQWVSRHTDGQTLSTALNQDL